MPLLTGNKYFFGGLQPPDEEGYGYGDVWILSIPSFTWTNVRCILRTAIGSLLKIFIQWYGQRSQRQLMGGHRVTSRCTSDELLKSVHERQRATLLWQQTPHRQLLALLILRLAMLVLSLAALLVAGLVS